MPGTPSPVPLTAAVEPVSAVTFLMKVVNWDGKSQEIHEVLAAAFDAKDYLECIRDLQARQIEPLSYINNLDQVSSYSIPSTSLDLSRFADRLLMAFQPTRNFGKDAYGR